MVLDFGTRLALGNELRECEDFWAADEADLREEEPDYSSWQVGIMGMVNSVVCHYLGRFKRLQEHNIQEATQAAVIAAWRAKEKAEACDAPVTYLRQTVRNAVQKWLRKHLQHECEVAMRDGFNPAAKTFRGFDAVDIADLLSQLPDADADLIRKRYLYGYTLEEVATAIGIDKATVLRRERRALASLRQLMGGK